MNGADWQPDKFNSFNFVFCARFCLSILYLTSVALHEPQSVSMSVYARNPKVQVEAARLEASPAAKAELEAMTLEAVARICNKHEGLHRIRRNFHAG